MANVKAKVTFLAEELRGERSNADTKSESLFVLSHSTHFGPLVIGQLALRLSLSRGLEGGRRPPPHPVQFQLITSCLEA